MQRLFSWLLLALLAGRSGCVQFSGHDVEPGTGLLRQLYTCFVPGDATALPLQLIGHVISFQGSDGAQVDRRPMLLSYAPYFAGQMFFVTGSLTPQVEMPGVHSYCVCPSGSRRPPREERFRVLLSLRSSWFLELLASFLSLLLQTSAW